MKKTLALFLSLIMIFSLGGCRSNKTTQSDTPANTKKNSSVISKTYSEIIKPNRPISTTGNQSLAIASAEKDFKFYSLALEKSFELFGKPVKSEQFPEEVLPIYFPAHTINSYDWGEIEFSEPDKKATVMLVTSSDISFIRDIKIGDSVQTAIDKFPDTSTQSYGVDNTFIDYLYGNLVNNDEPCAYIVYINGKSNMLKFRDVCPEGTDKYWNLEITFDENEEVSEMLIYFGITAAAY